jgi:PAS domain S-box-containing protein
LGDLEISPSYELLRALLEGLECANIGCTVVLTHPDRLVRVFANDAIARIYGLDLETMQSLDVLSMFTPDQRERLNALREAVAKGAPAPPSVASRVVRADGTEVPVELGLGHAMLGHLRATVVFMRDVTASRRMEDALRESEDRFRRLADASPDSITVFADGRYLYANRCALGHLRLSSLDDLTGFDPWTTVPQERRDEILEHVARLERGEAVPTLLHRVKGASGAEIVLESSLSTMQFSGRSALVSWTRDITERMNLQAELMKRDRLASVGLLAAGVAHEINNPLTALALQARKLRERAGELGLPGDVHASLEQIDEAAGRMSAIIGDLLFMARPVEQPQSHVDVSAILASTLSLMRAGREKLPEMVVDVDDLPLIRGYASKLAQVFFNVLRNALQAVEDRPDGRIRIRGCVSGDQVEITIADNGPGIPEELLSRVAQPFFTTRPGGTGLGLWMSQSIAELHGGSLKVQSSLEEGTTVVLVVPQRTVKAA